MFRVGGRKYFEKTNDNGQGGENGSSGKRVRFAIEDGKVKAVQYNAGEGILNSTSHELKVKGSNCSKQDNRDIDVGDLDCQTGQDRDFNQRSLINGLSSVQSLSVNINNCGSTSNHGSNHGKYCNFIHV